MIISISNLDSDAQLILPFEKGHHTLSKMKYFEKLNSGTPVDFISAQSKGLECSLKLDSTAYYSNGNTKAKFYVITEHFPLYYVQEFDSIMTSSYSQGFHLMSNYKTPQPTYYQSVWASPSNSKYGYWEYIENGSRVKHEIWASMLLEQYEWYSSGQLKSETYYGQTHGEMKHAHYLENGSIAEDYNMASTTVGSFLKAYAYNSKGALILINTYHSLNGISTQGLQKREAFYPSGVLKMEENYVGTYSIKYYNEDGTERVK